MREKMVRELEITPTSVVGEHEMSLDWADALDEFLQSKSAQQEPKTVRFYQTQVGGIARWATARDIRLARFGEKEMEAYLRDRRTQRIADSTLRHDVIAAKAFSRWCARNGHVGTNRLADMDSPPRVEAAVKCPSPSEVKAVLVAVNSRMSAAQNPKVAKLTQAERMFHSRRNLAILYLLIDTACRIGEALSLRLQDVDYDGSSVVFTRTKNDAPRRVPITQPTIAAIRAYLRHRPKSDITEVLFLGVYGNPINPSTFSGIFREYCAYAGTSGWTLHGLRHYALTCIAKHDVLAASRIAGHKSLAVTNRYLHADPDYIRQSHAAAAPLGRLLDSAGSMRGRKKLVG